MSKADKGQSVTIIKKEEYIRKMEDFILLSETSTLTTDPTQKYQAKVKQVLNELKNTRLVKHHQIQPNIILTCFTTNPHRVRLILKTI